MSTDTKMYINNIYDVIFDFVPYKDLSKMYTSSVFSDIPDLQALLETKFTAMKYEKKTIFVIFSEFDLWKFPLAFYYDLVNLHRKSPIDYKSYSVRSRKGFGVRYIPIDAMRRYRGLLDYITAAKIAPQDGRFYIGTDKKYDNGMFLLGGNKLLLLIKHFSDYNVAQFVFDKPDKCNAKCIVKFSTSCTFGVEGFSSYTGKDDFLETKIYYLISSRLLYFSKTVIFYITDGNDELLEKFHEIIKKFMNLETVDKYFPRGKKVMIHMFGVGKVVYEIADGKIKQI